MGDRTYLRVPYDEKEEAKALGARWDSDERSWYVTDADLDEIPAEWIPAGPDERQYLNVPFEEKDQAKELGARWDPEEKSWYVVIPFANDRFQKWLP